MTLMSGSVCVSERERERKKERESGSFSKGEKTQAYVHFTVAPC